MRIIHILNSPNWSGASHYCVTLSRQLMDRGHDLLLLTEPGKPLDRARRMGIPCDESIRLNHRNPGLYVHALGRMKTIFRSFRPDLISSQINEGAWMAGLAARWFRPEAAVVRTRTDIDPPKGHFVNRFVHSAWTDHLVVGSHLHKRLCQQILGFPAEAIDVVHGAIDAVTFHPMPACVGPFRQSLGLDRQTVLIGLVARLDPVKGHEHAIAALELLAHAGVPHRLVLLGYENQRTFAWVREQASLAGVADRVVCSGYHEDLAAILPELDLGLITSIGSEANCRAGLEFMACGLPVVATTVGVIPEIIQDGEQGFLVPPGDPQATAAALAKLLVNPLLRQKLGGSGRRQVEKHFTLPGFGEATERAYQRALHRRQNILQGQENRSMG